jgi:hypothetical protein
LPKIKFFNYKEDSKKDQSMFYDDLADNLSTNFTKNLKNKIDLKNNLIIK